MPLLFTGCKSKQLTTAQQIVAQVPTPSPAASETIRARAAASVKAVILAHPAIGPWAYRFSSVCFEFSTFNLPTPQTLTAWLSAAEIFAPDNIDAVLKEIIAIYTKDYTTAAVIQGTGAPYLLLLGEGIQDGIAEAKAPVAVAATGIN